jgi:hypothetical protein
MMANTTTVVSTTGPVGVACWIRGAQQRDDNRVHRRDHQRHGHEEGEQQPARRATRGFLAGVEVHALLSYMRIR